MIVVSNTKRISALLLAAGSSSRFGSNKLLAQVNDVPMIVASISSLMIDAIQRVVVVVPSNQPKVAALAQSTGVDVVCCVDSEQGMGVSLSCGVKATLNSDGWLIALGDMPYIKSATVASITQALQGDAFIAAPCYQGVRGHPVGFGSLLASKLLALKGDEGARRIIEHHRERMRLIDVDDPGVVRDVDFPYQLSQGADASIWGSNEHLAGD